MTSITKKVKVKNEINIQELVDFEFKILTLLGYAKSIVINYKSLEAYHDDKEKCEWFLDAVQAVVYENKPLPPMP